MRRILIALIPGILLLFSCKDNRLPDSISVNFPPEIPQAGFAVEQISRACESTGIELYKNEENATTELRISLSIDPALGFETFKISQQKNRMYITGGDANGLMYGGIDLAEAIA